MSTLFRFTHLVRHPLPHSRDTSFGAAWRPAAGRADGLTGPTERLIETVAASARR